ncbi:MAG: hypothetical protein MK185_02825 [Saccharospirillaceae bacterium]|nr:hypothetical protein [Saccharospirillaceae bacterium]
MYFPSMVRQQGQASILTVLVLPMLATLSLGAVDAGQWLLQRQKLTEFSRVAAMNIAGRVALSKEKNNAQLLAEANAIASELSLAYFGDNKTTIIPMNPAQQVVISAERDVDSMFLGAFIESFRTVQVRYQARADYAYEPGALDMSFVVDVSSSMGAALSSGVTDSNFAQLQQTLLNLINDLPESVALGMVPYHELGGVNINGALWLPESYAQPTCVDGRGSSDNAASILAQLFDDPGNIQVTTKPQGGGEWLAEECPSQKVIPLTNDHILLQQSIRQMPDANGSSTASLQGFIWGVRTLLENWQGHWNLEDLPRPNTVADKVMVLLTDGADGAGSYTMRNLVDSGMCDEVRARGIDLWFVGFGIETLRQDDYFRRCFGDQFLTARNASQLEEVIKKIIASSARAKLRLINEDA